MYPVPLTVVPVIASGLTVDGLKMRGLMEGVSAGTSFIPSNLTGLAFWYEADNGVLDTSNNTVTDEATQVVNWQDQSGSNNTLSTIVGGLRLKLSAINGRQSIDFAKQNAETYLSVATAPTNIGTTGYSFFAVASPISTNKASVVMCWNRNLGNEFPFNTISIANSPAASYRGCGHDGTGYILPNAGAVSAVSNTPALLEQYAINSSVVTLIVNVTNSFTSTCGTLDNTQTYLYVGNSDGGQTNNNGFRGYIGEVLGYTHILSATERSKVRSYLTTKWGL